MKMFGSANFFALLCCILSCVINVSTGQYQPNWDSLDSRPLPQWYDNAKIGIFIHWGVFSVPSFGSEWFWANWEGNNSRYVEFMQKNYPRKFSYQEFAREFTAEFFDPNEWAELFVKSGARYVVLTSKHHEGYTLWPSKYSYSWNAKDVGPHRDLVGELAAAARNKNLTFGLYHSLYEWFNPMYLSDKRSNFTKNEFVQRKMLPEMYELVENYKPSVLWSDGDWEAPDSYWNSTEFLAWLYNESPVKNEVVVNDRWGKGIPCKHGDFYSCADRYNPGVLQNHKWENAMTIDLKSWGYRRNAKLSEYMSINDLLKTIAQTISCGGNILINVGPTKDGVITPIFEERLTEVGQWLSINGEAIYESKPWTYQNDSVTSGVWYTTRDNNVYAIVLDWPDDDNVLLLKSAATLFRSSYVTVSLLGNPENLEWSSDSNNGLVFIKFPDKSTVRSENAWVLKMTQGNDTNVFIL